MTDKSKHHAFPSRRLMPRDLQIMARMYRWGFLTGKVVRDYFWDGKDNRNHVKRLRVLERWGLVEPLKVHGPDDLSFRLTRTGCKILARKGIISATQKYQPQRYSTPYQHDKVLCELLMMLELLPTVANIENEKELRARYRDKLDAFSKLQGQYKVPDGRIILNTTTGDTVHISLELEMTVKGRSAYRKIFRDYQRLNDWQLLLYVLPDRQTLGRVALVFDELYRERDHLMALLRESPIYFAVLGDLKADAINAPIINGKCFTSLSGLAMGGPILNPYRRQTM